MNTRRSFIKQSAILGAGLLTIPIIGCSPGGDMQAPGFKVSLAEWSLRDRIRSGKMTHLDFPQVAQSEFAIEAVEYVSGFFDDKVEDMKYLKELKQRANDLGVTNVLIMVDMWGYHGTLASANASARKVAAENHRKWIDAAKYLGCHAIRVNAHGYEDASYEDARGYFVDGLSQLVGYGEDAGISVVVENHGGYSSNAQWLVEVIQGVGSDYCGTLPDFGNFRIDGEKGILYDALQGMRELIPYAKGVSAKANNFDVNGNETTMDFPAMLRVVEESDFEGYVGIEWGGGREPTMTAEDGIRATQAALNKYLLG
jgi:sugar phosphate isomerase/epimerase